MRCSRAAECHREPRRFHTSARHHSPDSPPEFSLLARLPSSDSFAEYLTGHVDQRVYYRTQDRAARSRYRGLLGDCLWPRK
ncbi:hypothetical protein CBM2631_A210041 [Cupriavidus taiwanensis]|nr:hypothetical protein CBM2617_A200048 [Cupriavidus taiwanensis]SOZ78835.1 hypothetical protein CBM2618_A180050 [Cupriavidus taiwanensis]SOZ79111.1 hypothetical protein CBM2622_A170048 [Cupriavidus taiwanensis]SPA13864.1 hypothetical protein CBM2631_A210041 [Cupriavidus taiwanensis]